MDNSNSTTANKAAVGAAIGAAVMWTLLAVIPAAVIEANPLPSEAIIVISTWVFCRLVPA